MSTICKNTGNRQELPCINCTCESSDSTDLLGQFIEAAKRDGVTRLIPTHPDDIRAALDAKDAEIERLRAALTLAANRMDVLALDHEYGTTRRNIAEDWAKETRAALGPNTQAERQP